MLNNFGGEVDDVAAEIRRYMQREETHFWIDVAPARGGCGGRRRWLSRLFGVLCCYSMKRKDVQPTNSVWRLGERRCFEADTEICQ